MAHLRRATMFGSVFLAAAALAAACGSTESSKFGWEFDSGTENADQDGSFGPGPGFGPGTEEDASTPIGDFQIEPAADQILTVPAGQTSPTVEYTATLDGKPVAAAWAIDRGDVGTIPKGPVASAVFSPKGTTGGVVTISAGLNGTVITRRVFVKLVAAQNGLDANNPAEQAQVANTKPQLSAGGGIGGVGGEGLGPAASAPDVAALNAPLDPTSKNLTFLYPFDKTVWPRGQRAPLLMWSWTTGDADAVKIELSTTSGSFAYAGTFGRPAILATTGGKFIRHPIPQDVWDMALSSAGKALGGTVDQLTVKLTVVRAGTAYGPISQTWDVAPASLSGTVYYNSYGTQLVKNWVNTDSAGNPIGAAILGVHPGDTGPKLIVGKDSPLYPNGIPKDDTGCRVCHVVASRGRWLLTQSELGTPTNGRSFLYDLTAPDIQASSVQLATEGVFGWAAMTNDASFALTNSVDPSSTNPTITNATANTAKSSFWAFGASPTTATMSGLPNNVAAGYPVFSPDNSMVAYLDATGKTADLSGPLMVAKYNSTTHAFSDVRTLVTPPAGSRIGFPSFLPDSSGILYEREVRPSTSDKVMVTRNGARSEIWWISLAVGATPVRLDALVGRGAGGAPSYLPVLANNHGIGGTPDPLSSYSETGFDDTTLSYEPTVLPIAVGGRAWVVFTSRRAYGNQLTAVPWLSWPPSYNTCDLGQATVKKLWLSAIDLGAPANSDPSHPAFYLPAQEILAGNSRGFWVLDPCRADGISCETGDQCCNGFCQPNGNEGALVCSNTPPNNQCSKTQEKCTSASDCCNKAESCINGFCAQSVVK